MNAAGQKVRREGRTLERMLHEFLTENRQELIKRCMLKAAKRDTSRVVPLVTPLTEPDHGVPVFLQQLVDALRVEETSPVNKGTETSGSSAASVREGARTAALHGKALLRDGYTVDQVVHGYGDVCQSITELAVEMNAAMTVAEFHTLNRMLDNAIADAVSSYTEHRDSASAQGAEDLHERMGTLADAMRLRVNIALKAMEALQVANIGVNGTTGSLVARNLVALRDLIDQSLPEIRLSSGMTAAPVRDRG